MTSEARRQGKILIVGHLPLYHPAVLKLKELLARENSDGWNPSTPTALARAALARAKSGGKRMRCRALLRTMSG